MTRYPRRPSGLLVPDYEVRGFRPSAFGGRGGVFRSRGPGSVVVVGGGAPTVTSISPTSGPEGTFVTLTGTNFISGGLVTTVGGVALTSRVLVNSTTIRGYVGTHANGAVDVYVETDNGNNTLVGAFTYDSSAGVPGDICEIDFEDGTFGTLTSIQGQSPSDRTPPYVWDVDGTTGAGGSAKSAHHDVPPNVTGAYGLVAPEYDPSQSLTRHNGIYIRLAYKQLAGFDNTRQVKLIRGLGGATGYQNFGTFALNGSGANEFMINTDGGGTSLFPDAAANDATAKANYAALGSPRPNDYRGDWHYYEFYQKQVDSTHNDYKLWLDGTLIIQYDNHVTGVIVALGNYWYGGFIADYFNPSANDDDHWIDDVGVSTAYMGVP